MSNVIFQEDNDGSKYLFMKDIDSASLSKMLCHVYKIDIPESDFDAELWDAALTYKVIFGGCWIWENKKLAENVVKNGVWGASTTIGFLRAASKQSLKLTIVKTTPNKWKTDTWPFQNL